MTEQQIEAKLVKSVKSAGGLCYKFVSPANPGVPDRLIILPGGRVIFAELKVETGSLQAIQRWQIEQMQQRGADVRVLKGPEQVKKFVDEVTRGEVSTT